MKPPEIDFMMTLNSILESLWEPGLITFCLLVAVVSNVGVFFVKVDFRVRLLVWKVACRIEMTQWRGAEMASPAAEVEPAEGGGGFASEL